MCTQITREPISNEEKIDNNLMVDDFVDPYYYTDIQRMNDLTINDVYGPTDYQHRIHNVSRDDYLKNFEDNDDMESSDVLNLDALSQSRADDLGLYFGDDSSYNSSISEMDSDVNFDESSWEKKRIEEWNSSDTAYWYLATANQIGASFDDLEPLNAYPGREFLSLSRDEFLRRMKNFGDKFYDELHKRHRRERCHSPFRNIRSDDESSTVSTNSLSDGESTMLKKCVQKRPPGRPPTRNPKVKVEKEKLWQFVRNLLLNPETCPSLIRWVDYKKKIFCFVKSDRVAKLWGARKNNKDNNMTYEKFSRAMRYYYEKGIFKPVIGRRLVYQFGPKATGLETDDPNFENFSRRMICRSRL